MSYFPYGGSYPEPKRNEPVCVKPVNPLPDNKMSNSTGDAGQDGYSVLSRASRFDGRRPLIGGRQEIEGPNLALEE